MIDTNYDTISSFGSKILLWYNFPVQIIPKIRLRPPKKLKFPITVTVLSTKRPVPRYLTDCLKRSIWAYTRVWSCFPSCLWSFFVDNIGNKGTLFNHIKLRLIIWAFRIKITGCVPDFRQFIFHLNNYSRQRLQFSWQIWSYLCGTSCKRTRNQRNLQRTFFRSFPILCIFSDNVLRIPCWLLALRSGLLWFTKYHVHHRTSYWWMLQFTITA